ncbi:MAG: SoxR reducing system RseC family protein [Tissierellia bacterium]|nr:SoxR reducing system RseC family protein [Tissierellia bacterium]
MEQLGYVRRVCDNMAEVEVRRISGCGGGCSSCGGSCGAPKIVVMMENRINAEAGDIVEIQAKPKNIIKYALIAYMIPFALLVFGIILGVNLFKSMNVKSYEVLGFLVGVAFLILSFIIVRRIDRNIRKRDEVAMEMIRVLE